MDDTDDVEEEAPPRDPFLSSRRTSGDYRKDDRRLSTDVTGDSMLSDRDDLKLPMRPGEGWVAL